MEFSRPKPKNALKAHTCLKITKPSKSKGERQRILQRSYKKIFDGVYF